MKIEQRGKPPFTVMSHELTVIRAHPARFDTFIEAMASIIDLTDRGRNIEGPIVIEPPLIRDVDGFIVFATSRKEDADILRQIDNEHIAIHQLEVVEHPYIHVIPEARGFCIECRKRVDRPSLKSHLSKQELDYQHQANNIATALITQSFLKGEIGSPEAQKRLLAKRVEILIVDCGEDIIRFLSEELKLDVNELEINLDQ